MMESSQPAAETANFFSLSSTPDSFPATPPYNAAAFEDGEMPHSHRTEETIRAEIAQVTIEIQELRQALKAKEHQLAALEKEVGITLLTKISSRVENTMDAVKKSSVYQKTQSAMHSAGEKIANSQATNAIRRTFSSAAEKTSTAFRNLTSKDKEKSAGAEGEAKPSVLHSFSEKWKQASASMRQSLHKMTKSGQESQESSSNIPEGMDAQQPGELPLGDKQFA